MNVTPAGPHRTIGNDSPFYVLKYDKRGQSESPETLEQTLNVMDDEPFTDIFIFAHGWNNDWTTATARYDHFLDGFEETFGHPCGRALLLGIFWPSTILVMPGEQAPQIAAGGGLPDDDAFALDIVTAELDEDAAARVKELAQRDALVDEEVDELAGLLSPVYGTGVEELGEESARPTPAALAESWRAGTPQVALPDEDEDEDDGGWGTADDLAQAPQAAAGLGILNPRVLVRGASVWVMKDRAARVGATAVAPIVHAALATEAKVHLLGHSFGAKVMLSALCAQPPQRPVHSMMLLQPAVNHLCFAELIAETGMPGGYRPALDRVTRPIFSTYSAHDAPLTRFFHWALRRKADLGEPLIAAWPEPPSKYAALGGYGPRGADAATQRVELEESGQNYTLDPAKPLAAVNATAGISGHSAISNAWTWWALRELID